MRAQMEIIRHFQRQVVDVSRGQQQGYRRSILGRRNERQDSVQSKEVHHSIRNYDAGNKHKFLCFSIL
jgi:hypothetical protein